MKCSIKYTLTTIACIAAAGSTAESAFTITGFPSAQWQATDATLGLTGVAIENFEDTTLLPGVQVTLQVGASTFGPSNTLPNTFDPRNTAGGGNDPFGNVFEAGLWDATHLLINRLGNSLSDATSYNSGGWGKMIFTISGGTSVFGASFEQVNNSVDVIVNGSLIGTSSSFITSGSGRNGYLKIQATGGDQILSVELTPTNIGDGFAIDHLAVPEPSAHCLVVSGACFLMRRRHN